MGGTKRYGQFLRACFTGAATMVIASAAQAQNGFTGIQAFGDSYADTGNLIKLIGPQVLYPTGRFSGGTNFVDTTSALLGIPQTNFAYGGAATGTTNVVGPGLPGFTQEWTGFVAAGKTFARTDILELSIGGNDARAYYQTGGTLAGVSAAATVSAVQAQNGINALVGAGAKTLVFTTGDVGSLPEAAGFANAATGSAFSQNYNAQMQIALAAIARAGVRVESVDIVGIGNLIKANPGLYGITNVGACPIACLGNPALQSTYLFYIDGIHLTSRGFEILGQYIVNRLNAPLTFAPQADLALTSALGLSSTLFGRLDTFRELNAYVSPMNAYAQIGKAPYYKAPPVSANPWSFYMLANGGVSDRSSTISSTGYRLDSVGGTIGTEYRVGSHGVVGAVFDYSNPKARLLNNAGTTEANSYQFGLYGAYVNRNFFAQALATVGRQDYNNTRAGVVNTLSSNTDGASFVAAGKAGYLFDFWQGQAGPIGGLTYARTRLNGFTETGDPILTLTVGPQTAETLLASVGAQFRRSFTVNSQVINPYINLTVEKDVLGNSRNIQFDATSAPLIINTWNIPGGSQRVFGRVAGGVVAPVSNNVALTFNLSRTLGRQGGDDFYGNGGLKISF